MNINRLKTIDKVLGIVAIISILIAIFYRPLLIEAGVLCLFWLGIDMYVALKTSILDFLIDVLLIVVFIILPFFVPNIYNLSTLASIMPSIPGTSKEMLAKLVIISGLLVVVALSVVDVIHMLREEVIEL